MFMSTSGGYLLTGIYVGIPPTSVMNVQKTDDAQTDVVDAVADGAPSSKKMRADKNV
jgi:hypothetical protein